MVFGPLKSETTARDDAAADVATAVELDAVFRRYGSELVDFVFKSFGAGPPEPEDVVQTVFAKFAVFARAPHPIENPRALLYRMARNVAIDQRRRLAVRRRYAEEQAAAPDFGRQTLSPERELVCRQELAIIENAIAALPQRAREILLARQIDGRSYVEIARQWGLSPNGVKRIVVAALAQCEDALERAQRS